MSGLATFFFFALEWVVHHINIGIDHIYIGIYDNQTSWKNYQKLFEPFVNRGLVTLMSTKQFEFLDWDHKSRYAI